MQFTRSPSRQYTQYPQLPPRKPTPTRWPIFQPWTPSPIASIRPTASWPGTLGHSIGRIPSTVAESEWHTPHASTWMRTCCGGGSDNGFSASSSFPGLTACTARYVDFGFAIIPSVAYVHALIIHTSPVAGHVIGPRFLPNRRVGVALRCLGIDIRILRGFDVASRPDIN